MKKKILALFLALALVLSIGLMSGCQASNGNATGEPNFVVPEGGFDTSKPVTITFYSTQGENLKTITDAYIAKFMELYPNITVVHEKMGGYDDVRDQVATELQAGNQPNIAYCYPDHVALYNISNGVVTLDNLIDSTLTVQRADGTTETLGLTAEQKADFIEGYYNEGKQFGDGLMYTMPLSKSTEVLYYNKTFFDANGLTVPTTWDELEAVCKKIKELDPKSIPLGYDSEANWFITMCEQLGTDYTSATGDHFLFNNKENKEFVKKFREWFQKGYLTTQTIYGAYTSGLFVNIPTEDDPIRSYMSIGSSAGATHQRPAKVDGAYPFDVGIAPIPQMDASKPKAISQGPSLCILQDENTDPQEVMASWLLVKYLTANVEFQAKFADASGYVPVLKSVANNETYAGLLAQANGGDFISYLAAKVCLEQANAYYTSPAFVGSSTARDQVGALLVAALSKPDAELGGTLDAFLDKLFQDAVDECEYQS